jgi:hypothetical protein
MPSLESILIAFLIGLTCFFLIVQQVELWKHGRIVKRTRYYTRRGK